ncbi:MAG: HigA family addiction module antitoxin [Sphingomonas bacterium]|nr:HigA family addiction module antitoxin [Sphingomonas bacterium]
MSGSRITIAAEDPLDNVHPDDILRDNFLIGSEIAIDEVAAGTGISRERLSALLDGREAVDADADIRLARYLGMSEGLFRGLQNDYDLEEAYLAHATELDRIVPRAA